jgi:23S rRNA (cytosine1962-C5)-methyltransferase
MYKQRPHQQQRQAQKTYDLHPMSIKQIRSGHPWVTLDQYSEKFHPKEKFIIATDKRKPFALLIHDPTHKDVKARVWATSGNFQMMLKNFKNDIIMRLRKSFKTRFDKKYLEKRNHFYLTFGENDYIPGIFIRYFDGEILIEFYMEFWRAYQDFIVQNVVKIMNEMFKADIDVSDIFVQYRSQMKEVAKCLDPNTNFKRVDINEYGVNYKVYLGKHYDTGIYTDMAAIRERLKGQFSRAKSLLNLYSYTGAFSLFGLSHGMDHVTSVDLSENYLEWLDENLALNKNLDLSKHTSMAMSTKEALKELKNKEAKFDFIISDPPSSSSDGNRITNALDDYQETLPMMADVLSKDGQILVFLNTHKVSMDKFKGKIKNIIHRNKLPLYLAHNVYLGDDCPFRKGFPEGSYLKGITLKIKKPLENKAPQKEIKADESVEEVPSNPVSPSLDKLTAKSTPIPEEDKKEEVVKKVAKKKAAKKVTKKTAKKVTKKATKKVTKKAANKTTKNDKSQ